MILQRLWHDALCDEKEGMRQVVHSKGAKQAAKAAGAGGASGKRRGRPAKAAKAGETVGLHSEQMGLGL